MWLTPSKGTILVNYISATDWKMAVRRDNVISIKLRQIYNVEFLNQIAISQTSCLSSRGRVDHIPDLIHIKHCRESKLRAHGL